MCINTNIFQLLACREFCIYICSEFDWTVQNPDILVSEVDTETSLVCQFEIEISLTNRFSDVYNPLKYNEKLDAHGNRGNAAINTLHLSDEAFACRKFKICIEKGRFITGEDKKKGLSTWSATNFAYRLVFDSSPYPPEQMWKIHSWCEPSFWEWNEFCSQEVPPSSCGKIYRILFG
jgi:hypothetical protein